MKEYSRRDFLRLAGAAAGVVTASHLLSGCSYLESLPQIQTRDELFDLALERQGIKFSEEESNLWASDIPIERWNPTDPGNQLKIVQQRVMQLLSTKMMFSQNPYFRKTTEFIWENQAKLEIDFSMPDEIEAETMVIPRLEKNGEIIYRIKFALPEWRSNLGEERGLKDIDLALIIVQELASIKHFLHLEREGISQGMSGDDLFEYVTKPYKEYEACIDGSAYAYGEVTMGYFYAIGLIERRNYGTQYEDLLELLIKNNFDTESKGWEEGMVEMLGVCGSNLPIL